MTRIAKLTIAFCLLLLPAQLMAQTDNYGVTDTLYADLAKIDDLNWSITISYVNDQPVGGLSIPLQMTAGKNRLVADSAIYTGGRVEHFAFKGFRPDTAIQCVTLGIIANLGPSNNVLEKGSGRLVTIFLSSMDGKKIENLFVDTTTTFPNNSMMVVADRSLLGPVDSTYAMRMKELEIIPVFIVRKPE